MNQLFFLTSRDTFAKQIDGIPVEATRMAFRLLEADLEVLFYISTYNLGSGNYFSGCLCMLTAVNLRSETQNTTASPKHRCRNNCVSVYMACAE
ncbi:hypothetical protein SLE2022_223840 [Rubroshorea leprosula]